MVLITQQAAMGKGKRYSTRDSLSFAEEIPKKSVKELINEAVALLRSGPACRDLTSSTI